MIYDWDRIVEEETSNKYVYVLKRIAEKRMNRLRTEAYHPEYNPISWEERAHQAVKYIYGPDYSNSIIQKRTIRAAEFLKKHEENKFAKGYLVASGLHDYPKDDPSDDEWVTSDMLEG